MIEPRRIPLEEVRHKALSGSALLVCAYDNEEKFKRIHLENAISLGDFRSKLP
jgi:hypothetical protein